MGAGFPVPESQAVPDQSDGRFCFLTQVVGAGWGDDHLGVEAHLPIVLVADVVEKPLEIGRSIAPVPDGGRRLGKGVVGQSPEKPDGVEQIRFPDAVGSGYAGKGAKAHVHVHQVLKPGDF